MLFNFIRQYPGALSPILCDRLISSFESSPDLHERRETPTRTPRFTQLNITNASMIGRSEWKEAQDILTETTAFTAARYQEQLEIGHWPEHYGLEQIRLKRYDPATQDAFDLHVDVRDYQSARRFLVLFFYLNDVEEGGETIFPDLNLSFKPTKGTALVFPPLWLYPHAGLEPISSSKYIVGSYLHYL